MESGLGAGHRGGLIPGRTLRQWSRQCAMAESAECWHPGVSRCHHNHGDWQLNVRVSCGTLVFRMEAKDNVVYVHIYIYIYILNVS